MDKMRRQVCVVCCTLLVLVSGTYAADTCVDYLGSQCQDTAVQEVVCKDTASAPQFCAKTCGLCPTDKPSTVVTTPGMTTVTSVKPSGVCVDASSQCNDKEVLTVICLDKSTASQLCAKSCGLCPQSTTPRIKITTPLSIVTTPLTTEQTTAMSTTMSTTKTTSVDCMDNPTSHCDPKLATFICNDVHFSKFCPKMCGLCGGSNTTKAPVVMTTQVVTTAAPPMTSKSTLQSSTSHSSALQCMNAPDATCDSDPTLLRIICAQLETALRFCAKSCGVCGQTLPSTQMTTTRYLPTTVRTTAAASTCTDSTDIDCTDPQVHSVVCMDAETATKLCPKTCGKCVATTVDPCQDDPSGNCQDPDIKSFVCFDQDTARKLCPKTCNVCSKQNIGAPVVG